MVCGSNIVFSLQFTQTRLSLYAIYCSNYDNAESLVLKVKKKREVDMQLNVSGPSYFFSPCLLPFIRETR